MSVPRVLYFDQIEPIARGAGIITRPLAGAHLGTEGFTSGISTSPPSTAIAFHTHNVEESVTLLEGDAVCEFEGDSYRLKPWDTTYIPSGVSHRFVNVGDAPMSILWVYKGTHVTRTSTDTGETTGHMEPGDLGRK